MENESPSLRPALSITGGNPNGLPDYRPFNKLPRSEQDAFLRPLFENNFLYQVSVQDRASGKLIAVGPKCSEQTALALAEAINIQVALGNERTWAAAHVNLVI